MVTRLEQICNTLKNPGIIVVETKGLPVTSLKRKISPYDRCRCDLQYYDYKSVYFTVAPRRGVVSAGELNDFVDDSLNWEFSGEREHSTEHVLADYVTKRGLFCKKTERKEIKVLTHAHLSYFDKLLQVRVNYEFEKLLDDPATDFMQQPQERSQQEFCFGRTIILNVFPHAVLAALFAYDVDTRINGRFICQWIDYEVLNQLREIFREQDVGKRRRMLFQRFPSIKEYESIIDKYVSDPNIS